jgi:hypothetical protein
VVESTTKKPACVSMGDERENIEQNRLLFFYFFADEKVHLFSLSNFQIYVLLRVQLSNTINLPDPAAVVLHNVNLHNKEIINHF